MTCRVAPLLLLVLTGGCAEPDRPPLCPAELYYVPAEDEAPEGVRAVGSWEGETRLARREGFFGARIELPPGDYEYVLVVDGVERLDPRAPLSRFDEDGRERSILRVDDCTQPRWEVVSAEGSPAAGGTLVAEVAFVSGRDGGALDPSTVSASLRGSAPLVADVSGETVRLVAEGVGVGKHTAVLRGADLRGREIDELLLPLWVEEAPFDWEGALIYQVVVDRFACSGEPLDGGLEREEAIRRRHGGDLRGLTEVVRSGYFEELGVRALWISPLNRNAEGLWPGNDGRDYASYHGYWPVAPREVEPLFGGEEALEELVAELHGRGMRLIVDVVPNHVHLDHPYYVEHADDWFNGRGGCVCGVSCSWNDDLERCWFTPYLADLRWKSPVVAGQVVSDVLYWLEAFDLDGLRVDAVPMMPRLAVRHLAFAAAERLERGPTRLHLLGETYTGPGGWTTIAQYIGPFGLDGQFDFPLMWELRAVVGQGESTMASLDRVIAESEATWEGSGAVMSPILGNHDVPRFLSVAAGSDLSDHWSRPPARPDGDEPYDRLLLASAIVLTLPGAPVVYYGDEIGLPGAGDPDNRRPMRFDDELVERERHVLEAVRRLGRARLCSAALRRGERRTLLATDDALAYVRDAGDGLPAVVVASRAVEPQALGVELPEGLARSGSSFRDVLDGATVGVADGALEPLLLPPLSAMVLLPEGACPELFR